MTNLTPEPPESGPVIKGFGPSGFRIDDTHYDGGVILTPQHAHLWDAPAINNLSVEALSEFLSITPPPEFLLLGTGKTLVRPRAAFTRKLEAMDIGVEVMDSKAAARAWSILRVEERQIIAAIMPI